MSDAEKPTLLVVDGHSLAFRAFYALPVDSFPTSDGQHTNAIHGFLSMLLLLLQNEKPTHLAVAFDISRHSFRTREYPEYKGTRGETPSEFKGQVPLLQDALKAMSIRTLEKEDYEADDILATLAARGRAEGYRVLRRLGRPRHHPARQRRRHAALPEHAGRLAAEALRHRRGRRALRHPPRAVPRHRRARRRDERQPHRHRRRSARRPPSSGSASTAPSTASSSTPTRSRASSGSNLREQNENAIRNRRLNRLVTDVELDVALDELEAQADRRRGRARLFERLEFRTLIERVPKLAARRRQRQRRRGTAPRAVAPAADASAAPGAPEPARAARRGARDLARARRRGGARAASASASRCSTARRSAPASRRADRVRAPAMAARARRLRAVRGVARERRAQDHAPTRSRSSRRSARRASPFDGLAFDTLVAGWLLRPSLPDKTLADLVDRYLDETAARGRSRPARARDEGADAGAAEYAWYIAARRRRRARELARRASRQRARRHRAAARCRCSPTWSCAASRSPTTSSPRSPPSSASARPRLAAGGVRRDRPRGQPRFAEAAAGGALRPARHAEDPRDQDRLLDGCRVRSPTCRSRNPHPFLDLPARAPRRHEAAADRRVARQGDRRRRAHPHDATCRSAAATGRMSSQRPEPAEHPDPHRGGPPHPRGLPGRARATRRCSPPTTRRSRCASWRTSRRTPGSSRRSTPAKTCTASSARASSASTPPTSRRPCARRSRRCRTASPTASARSACRSSCASTRPRRSSS